ncbi:MAG: hypothetical protein KH813_06805 [Negativicoccus succinicivorans]|uniref:hypothetical protein n=1 Tax=Negativicoccus succinicivorans TaxID=620903 RepID=UPI0026EAACC8|nr:hypothetical protein [Negativicoccus succinicivorans]MBS6029109.1 hypothetical protein [Negativicoccus succinicivorans]MDU5530520.1 hypothetical protein [Negativicoccus succinicivorans]MDU5591238.1 hypothetical protein [Escherichia coli]
MQEINFESTLKSLAPLVYAYQKEVKEGTFEAYATYLADIPPEYIRRAVDNLIRSSKWLPTVAEIREQAQAEWAEDKGMEEETAEKAWILLLELVKKYSFQGIKRDKFSSDAAYNAMRAIGWRTVCMMTDSQMGYVHNEYVKAYEGVKGRKPVFIKKPEAIGHDKKRLLYKEA